LIQSGFNSINSFLTSNKNMSKTEAEDFMIEILNLNSEDPLINLKEIQSILDETFENINRFIDFYYSLNNSNTITKIYYFGDNAKIKGLKDFISRYFDIPAFLIDKGDFVKYKKKNKRQLFDEDFYKLINSFGAFIR
ncbi:hypothetical protein RBH29_11560, partial [Herbivorax sp. ANBcel31]|uniref:hypothetical protein n=1 Tax=Herbivorax sp. ANBcel31 TaxID=3069754 RepID=UPI0027B69310